MYDTVSSNFNINNNFPAFSFSKELTRETNHILGAGMRLKQYFYTPLYFSRFPFSLRALAPSIALEYIDFFNHDTHLKNQFVMWAGQLSFHLLALHKAPFFIALKYGFSLPVTAQSKINIKKMNDLFPGNNTLLGHSLLQQP